MIVLTSTDSLRLVTSSASAVDVHASYADSTATTFAPGRQNTAIAAATTSTVLSAPSSGVDRALKLLSVVPRGGAQTLTVEYFNGSTAFQLRSVALLAGESMHYEDATGWRILGVDGSLKQVTANSWINSLSTLGYTPPGSPATVTHTLLAAGHAPGMYQVHRALTQLAASVAGAVGITTAWKPPNAAAQAPSAPQQVYQQTTSAARSIVGLNLSNSATAAVGIAMPLPSSVLVSDGSADITQTFTLTSVVVAFDLYSSIQRVG